MTQAPCRDCTDRWFDGSKTCHGSCEKYKKYKEEREKELKSLRDFKEKYCGSRRW